ncbi:hypothetical protein [Streptomyces cinereoruber]|uniref:hypothetical protein n=1 Tax=Streptomyces cinereoruber TaxID=67260 RepID=UPI003C2E99DD
MADSQLSASNTGSATSRTNTTTDATSEGAQGETGEAPPTRDPQPCPTTAEDPGPSTGPLSLARRTLRAARARHARMNVADRIAFYGLLIGALTALVPLAQSLYDKAFPKNAVVLLVDVEKNPCMAGWILTPGNEHIKDVLWTSNEGQFARWEKENRIVHSGVVVAGVTARGAIGEAVAVRDISITVTGRGAPVRGTATKRGGCGALDAPEYLVVDLDGLPLNHPVPISYLQNSPKQNEARKAAAEMGKPITLPRQVTRNGIYSFFLTGRTTRYDTSWIATITWWDGEEEHTQRIDDEGRPIRVSAEPR